MTLNLQEEELVRKELARLPADMRSRVKVVLKKGEDEDDSDLEGIEQVDWVESANAKELLGNGCISLVRPIQTLIGRRNR